MRVPWLSPGCCSDTEEGALRTAIGIGGSADPAARQLARLGLPSPKPITTVGAWLLGSDPALALTGRRCVPTRLLHEFATTHIDEAVHAAVQQAS